MTSLTYRLYIDGAWQESEGDAVLTVLNPATEEVIGAVPDGTAGDVNRAVAAARRAFDEGPWPSFSPRERAAVMLRMADAMERRAGELKELAVREAGSTRALADTLQVNIPLLHFRDMAERVLLQFPFEKPMPPTVGPTLAQGVVRREPYGVAALISAYNFPLFLNILKLAPALAAGCTVVLKPAPTTPLEAFVLGEMADEAGLPPGVLNIVTGDADLERVVPTVMFAMTTHAGQGCSLLTRTLVHRSRLDELVSLVKAALDQVKVGNPADPDVTMGPLISAAQRAKVEGLIRTGQAEGAQIAYGGGRPAGLDKGFFVEPTLFVDVDNAMTIARKEFFGPVGAVIGFDDDEAVRLANDSEFGLGGGVWAADPVRAYEIAKRIRAGMIYINGGGAGSSPHTAFGGYKQSGLGLERGEYGLDEFLLSKSIIWSAR